MWTIAGAVLRVLGLTPVFSVVLKSGSAPVNCRSRTACIHSNSTERLAHRLGPRLLCLTGLRLALAGVVAMQPPAMARPMSATDLVTLSRPVGMAASPDGKWLAYVVRSVANPNYHSKTALYLLDLSATAPRPQLMDLPGIGTVLQPAFSPDGRQLYFLGMSAGEGQLWKLDLTSRTISQISRLPGGIEGFKLNRQGTKAVIWSDSLPPGGKPLVEGGVRAYDQFFTRHWDTWEDGRYSRLATMDLISGGDAANAVDIMGGLIGDSPTQPFGGSEEIDWSRDGRTIYFALRRMDDQPLIANVDLFAAPADASTPPMNLTTENSAVDNLPAISPDGRTLAYVAMRRPGYEADQQRLMLRDLATGKTVALTDPWDRSIVALAWAADGKSLLVTCYDELDRPLFRVDARSGRAVRITKGGSVGAFTPLPRGGIVYALSDLQAPDDLWQLDGKGATRRLTALNAAVFADIDPVSVTRFSFKGATGDTVWGQIIKPAGVTGKLPTALYIHGGPQTSSGNGWASRWNPKVFAAHGLAVVTIDYHGSVGYGQAFTDSIRDNWGSLPLEDLKLGLSAASLRDPSVDPGNACAMGPSFGGYMIAWIAGQWPDQFKCLVQHDGLFDLRSFAYETDELWPAMWEFRGGYHSSPQHTEQWNPINHINNWKTPMLVISGERDFRVPTTQAIATFAALQLKNVPSRLLVFENENHWVTQPKNVLRWHEEIFAWVDRWIKPKAR